jgi:hypothetical protein
MSRVIQLPNINLLEREIRESVEELRPPIHVRGKLDIGYSFNNQSLEIFEIRPRWNDEKIIDNSPIAKTRYNKSKKILKIYWKRANGKWEMGAL